MSASASASADEWHIHCYARSPAMLFRLNLIRDRVTSPCISRRLPSHSLDVGATARPTTTRSRGFTSCPKQRSLLLMRKGAHSPRPTLDQLRQAAPWLWVWCRNSHCRHRAPMALAPLIIRWGGDASSDLLRRSARCTHCRSKGADLQHPSARSSDIALAYHTRAEDWAVASG